MQLHLGFSVITCLIVTALTGACTESSTTANPDSGTPDGGTTVSEAGGGDASANKTELGTFSLECGTATKDFPIAVATSEVIRIDATWRTTSGDSVPEAVVLDAAGAEIDFNGNPLGFGPGLLSTTEKPTVFVHEFSTPAGSHTIRFKNAPPGCSPITVTASYTRISPAATNLTMATATSLTKSSPSAGHLGCNSERWYKLTLAAGEALSVAVTGERYVGVPTDINNTINLALLDGAGSPVMASGNPVEIGGEIGNAGTQVKLDHTVTDAGSYHIKVTPAGCSATITYDIKY